MLLIRGAAFVWTGARVLPGAAVLCDGGTVVAVGELDAPPGADVLDAAGCAVVPGLVNAHHHLLQTAFRTPAGLSEPLQTIARKICHGLPVGDQQPSAFVTQRDVPSAGNVDLGP